MKNSRLNLLSQTVPLVKFLLYSRIKIRIQKERIIITWVQFAHLEQLIMKGFISFI